VLAGTGGQQRWGVAVMDGEACWLPSDEAVSRGSDQARPEEGGQSPGEEQEEQDEEEETTEER